MRGKTISHLAAGALILLFMYAAVSKLADFDLYRFDMSRQPFSPWITDMLIHAIPALEIGLSLLLFFDRSRRSGLMLSFLLMSAFTIYVALAVFRLLPGAPCGCGGVIRTLTWTQHLWFNIFFTLLAFAGWITASPKQTVNTPSPPNALLQRSGSAENL